MVKDSSSTEPVEVVVWTDTQRASRDGQIINQMGRSARPIGVGGPRTAEVDALARRLDCPHQDDLRQLLMDRPAGSLLLGTMAGADAHDLAAAIAQGTLIMAVEPPASTLDAWQSLAGEPAAIGTGRHKRTSPAGAEDAAGAGKDAPDRRRPGRIVPTPSFERSAGWTGAANPLEILGAPQLTSFTSFGRLDDCSLFARLMDAWRSVLPLSDMPLSIDASLSGPLAQAPGDLRGLTGHLAAHGRLPSGGAVLLQVSDRAGNHFRALHVISSKGRLGVNDLRYHLYDVGGDLMDQAAPSVEPVSFVDLVADHWRQMLHRPAPPEPAQRQRADRVEQQAVACCLASLLSARTGEPESPGKLIDLAR